MNNDQAIKIGIAVITLVVITTGIFFFIKQSKDSVPTEPSQSYSSINSLGFTYLPVTPRISAYYDLGVDSGALVTEVIPKSPADIAGVEVGDVILSFNGDRIEAGVPLLRMMRACPVNHSINLEIQRGENVSIVEFMHIER